MITLGSSAVRKLARNARNGLRGDLPEADFWPGRFPVSPWLRKNARKDLTDSAD
jgi:hypothetical protein